MLIMINRKKLEELDDISLIWTCIEPTIQLIRGKSFAVKTEAYTHLTTGQRALLMFQMLYGHTKNGVEEFFSHQAYLLLNKGVWSQLKKGMQYFGDYNMMQLLEQMDIEFQNLKTDEFNELVEQHSVLIDNKAESSVSMSILNQSFREALPSTIKQVANYIRNNSDEFIKLID